jgi:glycosyltransferase involved in cell wall biosynthesis
MKPRPTIALCLECPLGQMGGVEMLAQELILGLPEDFDLVLVSADRDFNQCPAPFRQRLKAYFYWNYQEASPAKARQLIQDLGKAGVDLVNFHLGANYSWETHKFWRSPVYYCRHFKLPYLLTNHKVFPLLEGYNDPARSALARALILPKAWLSRAVILSATPCEVTVSQHDKRRMQRFFPLWAKQFRHLYHSRLSLKDIQPGDAGAPPAREKKIVCGGSIGPVKGQLVLARAFARLAPSFPEWTLEFIGREGDPAYRKQIDQVAASLSNPEKIRFAGVIGDFKILIEQLRRTAIYAQPSFIEGLPLALQEALSFGCPAVASAINGIPELIDPGINGFLVPPGDEKALAEALEKLMKDENLRQRMGCEASRGMLRRRMTREDMLSQYVELYHRLMATT